MKNTLYKLIFISFLIVIFMCSCEKKFKNKPRAVKGNINLSNWDFTKDGNIALDGEWEFYWNKLLIYEDFHNPDFNLKPIYVKVPSHWIYYKVNDKKVTGHGYATFRLKIKLSNKNQIMCMLIDTFGSSYKLWINKKLVSRNGVVSTNYREEKFEQISKKYFFIPDTDEIELIVQISNHHYKKGGFWRRIKIGIGNTIFKEQNQKIIFTLFIIGALFIMGIYHFILFLLRRNDRSTLIFGIFCFLISIRWFIGSYGFYTLIPESFSSIVKIKMEYFLTCVLSILLLLFFKNIFKKIFLNIFFYIFTGISSVCALLCIILPLRIYDYVINYFYYVIIFGVIYLLFVNIKAIILKEKEALILFIGFVFFVIAVFNDVGIALFGFSSIYLYSLGLFIFIFFQSFIISIRFSNAFKKVEDLSSQLKIHTISLEKKVEDRTHELKIANDKLTVTNRELEKLDKLKNDFIANITHDFRSPLMAIQNISDLAIKYDHINDEEILQSFKTIYESSIRLKSSIDKLLDVAKMDSGEIKLNLNKFELNSFLTEICSFYISAISHSNIKIIKKIPALKIKIYSDEEKLEEIINNVLSNAIKFVDPDTGKIIVELNQDKNNIIIIISDNGIGILKENLKKIFNRFYQEDTGSKYRGTGIGLAYSKQLIGFLKGEIYAESDGLGKGAKFIIKFKKGKKHFGINRSSKKNQIIRNKARNEIFTLVKTELDKHFTDKNIEVIIDKLNTDNSFNIKNALILIVEDNKKIRDIEKSYLIKAGFKNFILINNGIEGVDAVYKYHPDIIISDYNLPGIRGDKFHDDIYGNPDLKFIPFIFISAIPKNRLSKFIRKKGVLEFINKPIDGDELISTIESKLTIYMEYKKTLINAVKDKLTGLYKKLYLMKMLKKIISRREYKDFSIILIDISDLKKYNEEYGYRTGDLILKKIGELLLSILRNSDIVGRYKGGEIIIGLPDTNLKNAEILVNKIKLMIKKIDISNYKIDINIYYGISSLIDNSDFISEKLNIKNVENIFNVKDKKSADWTYIENVKFMILDLLIDIARVSCYQAKKQDIKTFQDI